MAKKTVMLRALGRVDYNGGVHVPGTDDELFECDADEAKRLKNLKVAEDAEAVSRPRGAKSKAEQEEAERLAEQQEAARLAAEAHAALLAKIALAANEDELNALLPDEEPADEVAAAEIVAACEKRLAELSNPQV
jgi:Xaa-Pro aminopeptidase